MENDITSNGQAQITVENVAQNPSSPIDGQQAKVEEEIPTRLTAKDFYYQRKLEQVKKQHEKELADARAKLENTPMGDDVDVIKESYAEAQKQIRTMELGQYLTANPEFAPYAEKIKKFAEHPDYAHLPTEQLVFASVGKDLLGIVKGAEQIKASNSLAAANTPLSGTGNFVTPKKSIAEMTDEEFRAMQDNVKRGNI